MEKIYTFPRGHVNSVSVHPSGRLALSVSKDKTLRYCIKVKQILSLYLTYKLHQDNFLSLLVTLK